MTDRPAEGAKQDVSLRREPQTAGHARLAQLGVPVVRRFLRHGRKATLGSTAAAILRDAKTQLITITIALDSRRVAAFRPCRGACDHGIAPDAARPRSGAMSPQRETGRKEKQKRD